MKTPTPAEGGGMKGRWWAVGERENGQGEGFGRKRNCDGNCFNSEYCNFVIIRIKLIKYIILSGKTVCPFRVPCCLAAAFCFLPWVGITNGI